MAGSACFAVGRQGDAGRRGSTPQRPGPAAPLRQGGLERLRKTRPVGTPRGSRSNSNACPGNRRMAARPVGQSRLAGWASSGKAGGGRGGSAPLPWRESRPPPPSRPQLLRGGSTTARLCRQSTLVGTYRRYRRDTRGPRHLVGLTRSRGGGGAGDAAGPAQGRRWGPWPGQRAPAGAPDDVDDHRGDDHRQQDAAAVSVTRDQPPDQPGEQRGGDAEQDRLPDRHRIRPGSTRRPSAPMTRPLSARTSR